MSRKSAPAKPNAVTALLDAARRVWDTYLDYGPVDDGRPEGEAFEAALDALLEPMVEVKHDPKSGYCPTLTIRVRWRRIPHGRGRNAGRYEATDSESRDPIAGYLQCEWGRNEAEAVGKVLMVRLSQGELSPKIIILREL